MPIIFLKIFPPKNSETSIISELLKFLKSFITIYKIIRNIIDTYIIFKGVEEPQDSIIFLGKFRTILFNITTIINAIASIYPILA